MLDVVVVCNFMMCIKRTVIFMCDSIDFCGLSHTPRRIAPSFPLLFFPFFSFSSPRTVTGRPREPGEDLFALSPFPPPPSPMHASNILRDVTRPAFGVAQARQARRRARISESACRILLYPLQNVISRDTFQNRHPRPPLFLFFSLIQHGMARRMIPPFPLFDH